MAELDSGWGPALSILSSRVGTTSSNITGLTATSAQCFLKASPSGVDVQAEMGAPDRHQGEKGQVVTPSLERPAQTFHLTSEPTSLINGLLV